MNSASLIKLLGLQSSKKKKKLNISRVSSKKWKKVWFN
jgi:hypothetical protein